MYDLYDPDKCLTKENRNLLIHVLRSQVLEFDPYLADFLYGYIHRNEKNRSHWLPLIKILDNKLSDYIILRGDYRTTDDAFLKICENPWEQSIDLNKEQE